MPIERILQEWQRALARRRLLREALAALAWWIGVGGLVALVARVAPPVLVVAGGVMVAGVATAIHLGRVVGRRPSPEWVARAADRALGGGCLFRTALHAEGGRCAGSPDLVDAVVAHAVSRSSAVVLPMPRLPLVRLVAAVVLAIAAGVGSGAPPPQLLVLAEAPAEEQAQRIPRLTRWAGRRLAPGGPQGSGISGTIGDVEAGALAEAGGAAQLAAALAEGAGANEPGAAPPVEPEEDAEPEEQIFGASRHADPKQTSAGRAGSGTAPASEQDGAGGERDDQPALPGREGVAGEDGSQESDAGPEDQAGAAMGSGDSPSQSDPEVQQGAASQPGDPTEPLGEPADDLSLGDIAEGEPGVGGVNDAPGTSEDGVVPTGPPLEVSMEWVESQWADSPRGLLHVLEDGQLGERSTVAYREVHTHYSSIAESATRQAEIPLTRRAYIRSYFEAIHPR